jgi:hypothetical protein
LEKQRLSYSDLLKTLEVPADAPKTKTCMCCGQQMHMVQVNPYFVYFVHNVDEQEKCASKNPTGAKLPVIWSNKLIIRKKLEGYFELVTGKKPTEPKPFENEVEVKP